MNREYSKGFTLVELMVVLFVAALLLGIGIPSFNDFMANNRMAAAVNDVVTGLHMARSEAVKRRTNVTVCPSADWNTANPTCNAGAPFASGWIVFVDCSNPPPPVGTCGAPNLVVDGFDLVINAHGPLPPDIANNFTSADINNVPGGGQLYLSFAATGFPRVAPGFAPPRGHFQLCDARGDHDTGAGVAAGRWVQIGATGRPQIYRDRAYVQGGQNPLGGC